MSKIRCAVIGGANGTPSYRPYRGALEVSAAIEELKGGVNTKYNEEAVFHCVNLITNKNFQFG